ncbi:epoxide hydrolase N-terminal domain-containing protein, partial [Serratia marcescens]
MDQDMTDRAIKPFTVNVSDAEIDDLKSRIRNTRWLDDFENESWKYGMPQSYLRELADYWVT